MSTARQVEALLTAEQFLDLPDIGPCELVDGKVVTTTPPGGIHGFLEGRLTRLLGNFVEERSLGWVFSGEVAIVTRRDPDRVRGADVAFISKDRMPGGPQNGPLPVPPDLVVEVVSPSDRWTDVSVKIDECLAIGVFRVWVVDPENRVVRVYRSGTEKLVSANDVLRGEGALDGFELALATYSADAQEGGGPFSL